MKLKIKVTKEILHKSRFCMAKASQNCAVAVAIREIFPEALVGEAFISPFRDVKYFMGGTYFIDHFNSDQDVIMLPLRARLFIRSFDSKISEERAQMNELEFEIDISDKILEKIGNGNLEEVHKIIANSSTLELINT